MDLSTSVLLATAVSIAVVWVGILAAKMVYRLMDDH